MMDVWTKGQVRMNNQSHSVKDSQLDHSSLHRGGRHTITVNHDFYITGNAHNLIFSKICTEEIFNQNILCIDTVVEEICTQTKNLPIKESS